MVQCPELCGRIASSLTRTPSAVSNSSTASMPTTPTRSAMRTAGSCAAWARWAGDAEPVGEADGEFLCGRGQLVGQTRRRREYLRAHPVALDGLHDRPHR